MVQAFGTISVEANNYQRTTAYCGKNLYNENKSHQVFNDMSATVEWGPKGEDGSVHIDLTEKAKACNLINTTQFLAAHASDELRVLHGAPLLDPELLH